MSRLNRNNGFTFIEVLVAMLIFVMAVLAAVNVVQGAVRATNDAKQLTIATWLLQNVMVELETKIDTLGIDKGCEAKKEALFDPPYQNYKWTAYCYDIPFNLSSTATKKLNAKETDASSNVETVNMVQNMVLDIASQYMGKAIRELHVEVNWVQGKNKKQIDATTHYARYDLPIALPAIGVGGATTGTSSSTSTGGTTP